MIRFLLFFFLVPVISGAAAENQKLVKLAVHKDSSIKGSQPVNPKDGFKDLFIQKVNNGVGISALNPRAISFVQDYMQLHSNRLNRMKGWGKPYFDMISQVLVSKGLPAELKYLSVIESDLKSSAVSWAGAVGPWQLMPETARNLGLQVNGHIDERTDYIKSTHAAAHYLNDLYQLFNDWLLVIAAYNGGPGNVNRAIRKSGSRNFWDLQYFLPAESRTHVKKFIATHYIMEGAGGVTTLTKSENADRLLHNNQDARPLPPGFISQSISGKYISYAIAQQLGMSLIEFSKLNPNFDRQLSDSGSYELHLPADKSALFLSRKEKILDQSIQYLLAN